MYRAESYKEREYFITPNRIPLDLFVLFALFKFHFLFTERQV